MKTSVQQEHYPQLIFVKHLYTLLLFVYFFTNTAFSQSQTFTKYDTCSALQQLEGEWLYQSGQEQIKIFLRYKRLTSYGAETGSIRDFVSDRLMGWVEYKVGSTIMESTYSNRYMTLVDNFNAYPVGSYSILLAYDHITGCNSDSLWGMIRDYGHSNQRKIISAKLTNNNQTITWTQNHSEGYGAFNGDYGMTLPRQFVLTKQ